MILKDVFAFLVVINTTLTLALPKLSKTARRDMVVDISHQGQTELGTQPIVILNFQQSTHAFPEALRASKDLASYVQVSPSRAKVVLYPKHSDEVVRSLEDQGHVLYAEDVLVEPELEQEVVAALSHIAKANSRKVVYVDLGTVEDADNVVAGGAMMRRNTASRKNTALMTSGSGSSLLEDSSTVAAAEIMADTESDLHALEHVKPKKPPASRPPSVMIYLLLAIGVGAFAACFCLGGWYVLTSIASCGDIDSDRGPSYLNQANLAQTTGSSASPPNPKEEDSDSADDVPLKAAAAKTPTEAKAQDSDEEEHDF